MARATKAMQSGSLEHRLTVNTDELSNMLGMGREAAETIGRKAGAIIRVGRLKRYNVAKVTEYLNRIAEG